MAKWTKSELSDAMGVSTRTVSNWQNRGMPVAVRRSSPEGNLYDSAACIEWRIRERVSETVTISNGQTLDYEAERARLTKAQADKTELEVAQLNGLLIRSDVVAQTWQAMTAAAKAKFLAMPTQIANAVIAATDLQEVVEAVSNPIREALSDLSSDGLPTGIRAVLERDRANMGATATADGEPVGGKVAPIKRRKRRNARPVAQ